MDRAAADAATQVLLAQIWQRNLPQLLDRLHTLDQAATAALCGPLPPDIHDLALANAHKLAGSLGMFGYPRGTDLAREIEILLHSTQAPDGQHLTGLTTQLRAELNLNT